jgi:threonine dehydrogenase-like Zn-dependent dehydrogenase
MLGAMTHEGVRTLMVDTVDEKLELAEKAGAAAVINARREDPVDAVRRFTDGRGAAVAIEAVGLPRTVNQAILCLRKAGRAVLMGAPWERIVFEFENYRRDFLFKELRISSSITNRKDEMEPLIELVKTRRIDLSNSVSLKLPFEKINEGIEIVKNNVGNPIRVVLEFD